MRERRMGCEGDWMCNGVMFLNDWSGGWWMLLYMLGEIVDTASRAEHGKGRI